MSTGIPVLGKDRIEYQKLSEALPEAILGVAVHSGETYLLVVRDSIPEVLRFLKEDAELAYDYFVECLGVDYLTWPHGRDLPERFEVVYNLFSTKSASRIFLKVGANLDEKVPTSKHVFLGAEYPEKEIADLYGIEFAGNELIGRFMMPDDWVGFPLRKDVGLGGEDVVFADGTRGPAVEDLQMPHAGESFEGKTGSEDVSGR